MGGLFRYHMTTTMKKKKSAIRSLWNIYICMHDTYKKDRKREKEQERKRGTERKIFI